MKIKKLATLLLLMTISRSAISGFNGVTHHSRANCGYNESVSWHWKHKWWFWVNSDHIDKKTGAVVHSLISKWQQTWRNVMFHKGEGNGRWIVHGSHWMLDVSGNPILMKNEYVDDCSGYDGWWDKNKR